MWYMLIIFLSFSGTPADGSIIGVTDNKAACYDMGRRLTEDFAAPYSGSKWRYICAEIKQEMET